MKEFKYLFLALFAIAFGKYCLFNGGAWDILLMSLCGTLSFVAELNLFAQREAKLAERMDKLHTSLQELVLIIGDYRQDQRKAEAELSEVKSAVNIGKMGHQVKTAWR